MGFTITEQEPNDNVASFAKNAKVSKLKKAAIIAGSAAGVGAVGLGGAKAIKALRSAKKAKEVVATGTAAANATRSAARYEKLTQKALPSGAKYKPSSPSYDKVIAQAKVISNAKKNEAIILGALRKSDTSALNSRPVAPKKTRNSVSASTGAEVPITRRAGSGKKTRLNSSAKSDNSALRTKTTKTGRSFPELVTTNPAAKTTKVKGKLRSGSDVKLSTVKRKAELKKFDSAKAKLSANTSPSKRQANSSKVAKRLETISNDSRLQTLLSSSQRNSKRLQSTKDLKVPNDVKGNAVLQKRRNTKDNLKLTKADLKRRLNDMRSRGEYSSALAAMANF
jgi:hypothetical protein